MRRPNAMSRGGGAALVRSRRAGSGAQRGYGVDPVPGQLQFQGHADQIAQAIAELAEKRPEQCEELLQQVGYFDNHQHRMNYLEMCADGWVIGSGRVESSGKRFKDHFTRAGIRWSRNDTERLSPFRRRDEWPI
jgi:hypothetical protein